MFIKKRILAILAGLIVVAMLAEALLVARIKEAFIVHEYHGVLNGKVGQPYQQLVQELLARYEAGDMDALGRALKSADARKHQMNHVWLSDDSHDAYRTSVGEILK